MNHFFRVLAVIGLIVSAMSLQACRVNSAVIIGDDPYYGGHHHWCGYDRWGRYYCTRYSPIAGLDEQVDPSVTFTSHDERVARVSEKYSISHYAATYVVRAVLLAEQKDMSGLADLGLTKKDMEDVYAGKELSSSKVTFLSEKLLMTNEDTEKLAAKLAAAVESSRK